MEETDVFRLPLITIVAVLGKKKKKTSPLSLFTPPFCSINTHIYLGMFEFIFGQ